MVERDLAEVVRAMSGDQLRDTRRDLAVSLALAWPGSPVRASITAEISAIDAELAGRGIALVNGR